MNDLRVLVLGGGGMLGHKLFQTLTGRCDVYATFRRYDGRLKQTGVFETNRVVDGVDAWDLQSVSRALSEVRPTWVVNCIGIIKQLAEARDPKTSIYINALFPHLLSELCTTASARVLHISTDCVFAGNKGSYVEGDPSDAEDLYGKTKFLGELDYPHALTLRTSVIGRDLFSDVSLVDWFLSQAGKRVRGYTDAIYTGLSTEALSQEIWRIMSQLPELQGLYHVSTNTITKFALLQLLNESFQARVTIDPFDGVHCDRSLMSDRYRKATGFTPPSWEAMVASMARDPTPYDRFREVADSRRTHGV